MYIMGLSSLIKVGVNLTTEAMLESIKCVIQQIKAQKTISEKRARESANKEIGNDDDSDDMEDDEWSDDYNSEGGKSDGDQDSQSNDAVDGGSVKKTTQDPEMMEESKTPTPNEADSLSNILAGPGEDEYDASIFELKVTLDSITTPISEKSSNAFFCESLTQVSREQTPIFSTVIS